MAATRILSVIGRKGAGKTTLIIALAGEFTRKGRRVMTIKHARQPVAVDKADSDSYRLFHEAASWGPASSARLPILAGIWLPERRRATSSVTW